jgi:release factor glutamine methyltransferase
VVGLDISAEALHLAQFNAAHNSVENQLKLIQGDILDPEFVPALGAFDCVVSNPPYVALSEKGGLQPEITRFEPEAAVFSGDDPLIFFKTIVGNISYILKPGGLLAFEVGRGQAHVVASMMRGNFERIVIARDLAGIERVITGIYARLDKR